MLTNDVSQCCAPRDVSLLELTGIAGSLGHLAYHFIAIRQLAPAARAPRDGASSQASRGPR